MNFLKLNVKFLEIFIIFAFMKRKIIDIVSLKYIYQLKNKIFLFDVH